MSAYNNKMADGSPETPKPKQAVGYGNPPAEHRFKKGKSGNPKGRPRGSKNTLKGSKHMLEKYILSEAGRKIEITEHGKPITMTTANTIIRVTNTAAMKGDLQAAKLMINLIKDAETGQEKRILEAAQQAYEYKGKAAEFIRYHLEHGYPFDMPIPHPDHVHINDETFEVTVEGPAHKSGLKATLVCLNIIANMEVEAMIDGCAQSWIEKALKYEETSEPLRCKHEEHSHGLKQELVCKDLDCCIWKFQKDDDNFTMKYYRKFREQTPVDDPLWLFYGPRLINNWIDFHFYYGPRPRLIEEANLSGYTPQQLNQPDYKTSVIQFAPDRFVDEFQIYMREKLSEIMEAEWFDRFKQSNHVKRDISYDRMRFEFHTGDFDPDNYVIDTSEQALFRDDEFLEKYMRWV